nr:beta-1,3-glucan-binding protein-like [Onthophagus taurus]
MSAIALLIFISFFGVEVIAEYIVPEPTIEVFHPKGFTVSIPDDGEIKLFAFHGKINEEFDGREAGTFARDITLAKNGKWTFTDRNTRLKKGDIIYYWLYVINKNDNLGYLREHEFYTVTDIQNGNNKNNQPNNNNNNKNEQPTKAPPVITTSSVCYETLTKVNGASSCSGRLIFSEEFSDINRWQKEIRFASEPDYEFVTYTDDADNLYLRNGQIHFKPILAEDKYEVGFVTSSKEFDLKLRCTSSIENECKRKAVGANILPPVFSSRINTRPSFSFLYGKVEIKAKLPKGNWIYPELYLTPKKFSYGSGFNSGEMRIAFVLGNEHLNGALCGGLILGDDEKGRNFALKKIIKNINWSDDFHIFGLEWYRDKVTVSVDGVPYGNIYPPSGGFGDGYKSPSSEKWKQGDVMAPFDQEMIITLGVGVGGHAIPDVEGKPYTNQDSKEVFHFYKAKHNYLPSWQEGNELIVDYVKVFAL